MSSIFLNMNEFTEEDLKSEIMAMKREELKAQSMVEGFRTAITQLQGEFISRFLNASNIKEGDMCLMEFDDGAEEVKFVKHENGFIRVLHIGSKGKLRKGTTFYEYTYAELMNNLSEKAGAK